jgi:aryl-alcohol dehydrogenase-like predicted oxidoreductase
MKHIKFGPTDLLVSPIGLGCMSMSGCYGQQDDEECIATIRRALELGVNLLDTSYNYGEGHNQTLVARAIKGRREDVVIHSKTGSSRVSGNYVSGTPEHLRKTCETSLERLEIDCLDVICMSRIDPVVPIEESVGAMAQLVEEGKTRHIAISKDASPELIRRAWAVHPIVSLQDEYSLFIRDPEGGLLEKCRKQGMAFMAFAPLGRGILTGQFRSVETVPEGDRRHRDPRYQRGNIEHNVSIVEKLEEIAVEKGISIGTLALAWLMTREGAVIPIPSSKSRDHLEENVAATNVELSAEDLAQIESICPPGAAAGASNMVL